MRARSPAMMVTMRPMKATMRLQQPVRKAQETLKMEGHFCLEGKEEKNVRVTFSINQNRDLDSSKK